ncbi:MAG: hypothetical protein AAB965_02040 [Patescibacteria group bacterium]
MPNDEIKTTGSTSSQQATTIIPTTLTAEELAEQKRLAMIAMEGAEGREKREAQERKVEEEKKKSTLSAEKTEIMKKMGELNVEKEKLELHWIQLNQQKAPMDANLGPIIADEIKVEKEEEDTNKLEHSTVDITEKHNLEAKRWEIEERRKKIEEDRWKIEEEIKKISAIIEETGASYRAILAKEDESQKKLDEINKFLAVYGE